MSTSGDATLAEVISEAVATLTHFTIPLYQDNDGRPSLCGTGFLVKADESNYLVSAAHVFDIASEHGLFFYSSPNTLRHLDGHMVRSRFSESRKTDLVDIGVLKLSGEGVPPFPEVRRYAMDISYLQASKLPREGKNYVIIGYPFTKNRFNIPDKTVLAAPYAYRSESITEIEYPEYGVSTESHVILPLDQNKGFDHSGRPVNFPKPEGMSGGPMTILYGDHEDDSRVFPVVAVGIEYRKNKKVMIATDVKYVLDAISHAA